MFFGAIIQKIEGAKNDKFKFRKLSSKVPETCYKLFFRIGIP